MTSATRACPSCSTPLPEAAQFCMHCGAATPPDPGAPPRTEATGAIEVDRVRRKLADRYRIERVLGEGGMATVYLAEDLRHRRRVAVKVMRAELAVSVGADRFLREIEIAAQLSHPHILPVYDSGDADGVLYYVMPYIEGESLREKMQRDTQVPVEEAVRLAREVSEALAYAHERGIIHRDIKPANILLSAGHALVADFGIARALRAGAVLTQTGLAVGTPQYMSPEQASGARDIDGRSDVYAVGGVLYEMLSGEPPFTGPTPQAILARSLTEAVRPLESMRPGLPRAVTSTVMKALSRNPADRYQTVRELADALGVAFDASRSGVGTATSAPPTAARVGALFGVAAAGVLAAVYAIMRQMGLPPWLFALAVAMLAIGIPVLAVTRKAEERRLAGREVHGLRRLFTWRNAIAGGFLAVAMWAVVATTLAMRKGTGRETSGVKRLAVLPFENLGQAEDAYLADGIADQLRGKLTGLSEFQVTARSSSMQYRQTTKSPREVGQELGVDYLLSGTVRRAKGSGGTDRLQVIPELIDTRTGAASWQHTYDQDLTDVFGVQEEIAAQVASALGIALGAGEKTELSSRPTENLAAYDAFLRGDAIFQALAGADPLSLRRAASYYEQAVALDTTFGRAWAQLGRVRATLYFLSVPTPAEAEGARRAAERAQKFAPKAPETFLARSLYEQNVSHDEGKATDAAREGLALAPANVDLIVRVASLSLRTNPDEALRAQRRATEVDPRSVQSWAALSNTLVSLRRQAEAAEAADRGLTIDPSNFRLRQLKIMSFIARGDMDGARATLAAAPRDVDQAALVAYLATYNDLFWVLSDVQQTLLLTLPPGAFDNDRATWAAVRMQTYWMQGDKARARAFADSARVAYRAELADAPNDSQLHLLLGLALGYLGAREDAIREGTHSLDLLGSSPQRPYYNHQMARMFVLLGEKERAIDQLEAALRVPYVLSPGWLRVDPAFAALKGNARFDRLATGS